jgi:FkbM family methyltransferase
MVGNSSTESTAAPAPIPLADAYALIYGCRAAPEVLQHLRGVLRRAQVNGLSDLRAIIMALDRQTHPTPALVRFVATDLRQVDIGGFAIILDAADLSVSAPILASREWEPHLTGIFRRYLQPGMRVADIGANVGYYTLLAASIVGAHGEVLAFDPNSENARLILLSIAANGFKNVRLYPLALSDAPGHAYFSSHIGSNGGFLDPSASLADGHGLIVPTTRLDDLAPGRLDFLKLDTEGSEYRILKGATRALADSRPIVTTEFSCEMISRVSGIAPAEYLDFFRRLGYSIHLIDKGSGRLLPVDDTESFFRTWGSHVRIEDLLMLPPGKPVLQPA